jgi:leucyl aminopeptidase
MTVPALFVTTAALATVEADVLVIAVQRSDDGPRMLTDDPTLLAMQPGLALVGVTASTDELRRLPLDGFAAKSLALIGVGSEFTINDLRMAAGAATRQLRGVGSVALALPTTDDDGVLAVLEGAAIGAYAYTQHRVTSLAATKVPATSVTVVGSDNAELVDRATIVATAVHQVRDHVMAPPSHPPPAQRSTSPS